MTDVDDHVRDVDSEATLENENQETETDDAIIGVAFKWSLVVIGVFALVVIGVIAIVRAPREQEATTKAVIEPPLSIEVQADPPEVHFTDITREAGITFTHFNGATGDKLLPESLGGGVAFLDYDGDGDQDLLFTNGRPWPGDAVPDDQSPTLALYANNGNGRFTDVTTDAGLDVSLYGMGVAIGDFDGNGDVDVFLTAVGGNRLFANNGGVFRDVTAKAHVTGAEDAWSTCCSFVDVDNDGDLDLFVGNYVRWSREIDFEVDYRLVGMGRAYGPPMNFQGTFSYLYRNNGDGTFTDVSTSAGIQVTNPATDRPMGKALGVAPVDVDRDGYIDLLVANDTVRNFLFHNNGDGTFAERGVEFGLAFDRNGGATGAMGMDAGYYRNDDALGFFIGNFANEMTSLYVSQGDVSLYADEAIGEGIGSPTRLALSFGITLFDYDLDGRLDLLQANGHLEEDINLVQPSQHYKQSAQLFWNCGSGARGCFVPVSPANAGDLSKPIVGRGSAFSDIDGDGDLDVVLTQVGRPPLLLRNDQRLAAHWIRIKLVGRAPNTSAIGAMMEVHAGDLVMRRQVMPTRSYLSQSELPVTFGLGSHDRVDSLRVIWPAGDVSEHPNLGTDQLQILTEPK